MPPYRFDDLAIAKLKKLPQDGEYECEVIRSTEPVQDEPPYLPAILLAVNAYDGSILHPVITKGAIYDPNEMLNEFIKELLASEVYPLIIRVRTVEAQVLLKEFCRKAKIDLEFSEDMDFLDEAEESLLDRMEKSDALSDAINMLRAMSEEQMRMIPANMLIQLLEEEKQLPDDVREKIKRVLKRR